MIKPKINITIPTYNRDHCIDQAIKASLDQSYENISVTVVDDGSEDNTRETCKKYFDDDRFCYIQLAENAGTAQAKNVSILLSDYDAITFHDSDDIPQKNKILMQARAMFHQQHHAGKILNWGQLGYKEGEPLDVDVVVGAHKLIKLDSSVHTIDKRMSLIDDFFPNVQFPSKTEGDWILINSGLFRKSVFMQLGGYMNSVEEDREIRNRCIGTGLLFYYLEEPLLTKIEMGVSLTVSEDTGYSGHIREADRKEVWERVKKIKKADDMQSLKEELYEPIDLSEIKIKFISNPQALTLNEKIRHSPPKNLADKALSA